MPEENVDNQTQAKEGEGQSDQQVSWKDGLEESISSHPSMSNIPDVATLAKNYVNQQGLIGRKGIIPPKEGDEEDTNRFYNQLGRPETYDKYNTSKFEIPEDMKQFVKTEKVESFKKMAHKYGLTQKQFDGIMKEYTEENVSQIRGIIDSKNKETEELNEALKSEWGEQYAYKVDKAKSVLELANLEDKEIKETLANPKFLKVFAEIGNVISNDSLEGRSSGKRAMSLTDIDNEIRGMLDDTTSPLHDGGHRDHKNFLSRLNDLYRMKETLKK